MSIENVVIHVSDLAASVDFYRRHLRGEVLSSDADRAILDFVTATIELRLLPSGRPSHWSEDDAVGGFRHVGFKVVDLDGIVEGLDAAGVRFRSRPVDLDVEGIRIVFFFDPDGTVLELVERHLVYHVVRDEAGVAAERAQPTSARPRFDHVGHSVADQPAAVARYEAAGFVNVGAFLWPTLHLEFMHAGRTVVELFNVPGRSLPFESSVDAYGFVGIELSPPVGDLAEVGTLPDGRRLMRDPDGLGVIGTAPEDAR